MAKQNYRIAVVGAASLLGREIAEELATGLMAAADVVLLDDEADGKLEEVGGEATFLQKVEPAAFEGVDVAIFATRPDAEKHWKTAQQLGAAVVDASGALAGIPVRLPQAGEMTGAPGSGPFAPLDLSTNVVAAAHPVTAMLALVLHRLAKRTGITGAFATVLQPASENGAAALDEMHQQTVNLLSFQTVPKDQYDTQVSFNLLSRFGEDAKAQPASTRERVEAQLRHLLPQGVMQPVMQWLQAPVFHGFGVNLFITLADALSASNVRSALGGELIDIAGEDSEPVSNVSVAGQGSVLIELGPVSEQRESATLALWMAADNLKLTAQTAVACAVELTRLRPLGKVQ